METRSIYNLAALCLLGLAMTSCNSCNDKKNDNVPVVATQTDSIDQSAAAQPQDATQTAASSGAGNSQADGSSGTAAAQTQNRVGDDPKTGRNAGTNKSGYSAPNGTDAENHDGDQYTKNDQERRPTGPPIK